MTQPYNYHHGNDRGKTHCIICHEKLNWHKVAILNPVCSDKCYNVQICWTSILTGITRKRKSGSLLILAHQNRLRRQRNAQRTHNMNGKRAVAAIAACLVAGAVAFSPIYTMSQDEPCYAHPAIYTLSPLPIKPGPGMSGSILGRTEINVRYEVLGTGGKWNCWVNIEPGWIQRQPNLITHEAPVIRGIVSNPTPAPTPTLIPSELTNVPEIDGEPLFESRVRRALKFIFDGSQLQDWYEYVTSVVEYIEQTEEDLIYPDTVAEAIWGKGRVLIYPKGEVFPREEDIIRATPQEFNNLWLAGILVHEACHLHSDTEIKLWEYAKLYTEEIECYELQKEFVTEDTSNRTDLIRELIANIDGKIERYETRLRALQS